LGGNSLSDLLVFGRRAGLAAAQHAKQTPAPNLDEGQISAGESEALSAFQRQGGENPYAVHRDLQKVMQSLVGIFRVREDMEKALVELAKLKERAAHTSIEGSRMFNPGWHMAIELKSMLTVSEAVTRSALVREESRGAHSRIDFPELNPEWGTKNNITWRNGSEMELRQERLPELPAELKQVLAEDK
jgi:succinate dehydrogenase / fumarate reductase flavoprotein subunit